MKKPADWRGFSFC
ncbi:hypothetical protein YPPY25_4933, partial [Yersinia pestis PY-25]